LRDRWIKTRKIVGSELSFVPARGFRLTGWFTERESLNDLGARSGHELHRRAGFSPQGDPFADQASCGLKSTLLRRFIEAGMSRELGQQTKEALGCPSALNLNCFQA
jgi:hypothetical protein